MQASKRIPHVLIIGAGFAGIQAAKVLKGCPVTLIDKNSYTTMLPAIPDLAGGFLEPELLRHSIADLSPAAFVQDEIVSIDLEKRICASAGATLYPYDYLLVASGSAVNFFGFSESLERMHTINSLEDALRIRGAFPDFLEKTKKPALVFSGAGYTGVELAIALQKRALAMGVKLPVLMVEKASVPLAFLGRREKAYAASYLEALGISILTDTVVEHFDGSTVRLSNGAVVDNAFFVWSSGAQFAIPACSGRQKSLSDGRIMVNACLQIPEHPEVFIAGDSAAIADGRGAYLRRAVNFAWYSGRRAAKNIARAIDGKKLKPFKPVDPGWILPMHDRAIGRLLGFLPVRGKLPLRLHYLLCGIRNYGKNRIAFFKKAVTLLKETYMTQKIRNILFGTEGSGEISMLLLRVFTGAAMMTHGYGKLFGGLERFTQTVDAMGFPLPGVFAFMAAFSEFFGALFLAGGFMTKVWSFFLGSTMFVAAFIRHAADPFKARELALLYLAIFVFFMFKGGGKYSADYVIGKKLQ